MTRRPWYDSLTTEEKDHVVVLAILQHLLSVAPLAHSSRDVEVTEMLRVLESRWGVTATDYPSIDWKDAT
ncbi:hypothetical protein LCGC14_2473820 [marine sediment metagenome]|uniref:Uncharacterized protein n=1 Tax=marine sediment metagenome TaxID=412755 RepID=A0A0F9E3G0_9ZZZZ